MSMILRKHLSPMGFTPENPLISHMNNFSWESRLVVTAIAAGFAVGTILFACRVWNFILAVLDPRD